MLWYFVSVNIFIVSAKAILSYDPIIKIISNRKEKCKFLLKNTSQLSLNPQKKWNAMGTSRIQPVEQTLEKVNSLIHEIGITRIADITNMDRLKIPNFSAVLPGTEDYIWVYSGKGPTKNHARASVIMESIERFSSLPANFEGKIYRGTFKELSQSHHILKYDEVVEPVSFHLNEEMIMDYCIGYDLLNKTEVLVPAPLTIFRYTPSPPSVNPYSYFHTNGLASGNVIEEAICHALCEVVERDAVSLAEFTSSAFQYHVLKTVENSLVKSGFQLKSLDSKNFMDDDSIYPEIDLNSVEHFPIKRLVNRFRRSQIPLTVKDITSDLGIPTFIASSAEWINHEYGYLVEGHGTHPDARIALMRAITEVSQSRAANIQGSRDDLRKMKYDPENSDEHRSWQFIKSKEKRSFSDIHTFIYDDILEDIKFILSKLRTRGLEKAIVVNLTNSKLKIPVTRVIVPGLETFKINKVIIGQRAKESVKKWLGPNL